MQLAPLWVGPYLGSEVTEASGSWTDWVCWCSWEAAEMNVFLLGKESGSGLVVFTQMSPSCYCIKCITCCSCFSALAAVQFPPCKLNSNAEICLERSPRPCVMLGLVHGPCGSCGCQLGVWKARDSTMALDELGQPAGGKCIVPVWSHQGFAALG